MKSLKLVALAVVVALLLALGSTTLAQDKTTVEIWQFEGTDGDCFTEFVADNFPNPDIEVKVSLYPQAMLKDALRTALQAGEGPDIVQTDGPSAALLFVQAGLQAPLDEYAAQYGWEDRFAPWALELGKVDGQLYSLPGENETLVMYYNTKLFAENGWETPTTFDELFALADVIEEAGYIPFGPAYVIECQACVEWYVGVFLSHYAGPDKVYEALTGQRPWTDPAFVEAISKLNEMMQNDWLMGGADYFFTETFDSSWAMFGNGEIAIDFDGTWFPYADFFNDDMENAADWDWFPIPNNMNEDPFFVIGVGSSWGINAASKNPDAAAEVLDWMFLPEVDAAVFEICGNAPAPLKFEGDVFASTDPRIARIYTALGEASAAGNYGYTTWSFWPPKTNVWVYEGIAKVYTGDLSVEDYMAEMDKIFQEELAEGTVPPIPAR